VRQDAGHCTATPMAIAMCIKALPKRGTRKHNNRVGAGDRGDGCASRYWRAMVISVSARTAKSDFYLWWHTKLIQSCQKQKAEPTTPAICGQLIWIVIVPKASRKQKMDLLDVNR